MRWSSCSCLHISYMDPHCRDRDAAGKKNEHGKNDHSYPELFLSAPACRFPSSSALSLTTRLLFCHLTSVLISIAGFSDLFPLLYRRRDGKVRRVIRDHHSLESVIEIRLSWPDSGKKIIVPVELMEP